MRKIFKGKIIVAISIFLCLVLGTTALAVTGIIRTTNNSLEVTVDFNEVIQEDYEGVGSNLWNGPYKHTNMNDAYQLINAKRTATIEPAYMRMLFNPSYIVNLKADIKTQQYEWENGIYHWENPEAVAFFRRVKEFKEAGTTVLLNMGGAVAAEGDMQEWFAIKDVALSNFGMRSAPADLESFAKATRAVLEKCRELGYDNVKMVTFYNEVNANNYEAFFDKRIYWTEMIKKVHYELKDAGMRDKNNKSDYVEIFGTELVSVMDSGEINFIKYVKDNLVDDENVPIYDAFATHIYPNVFNPGGTTNYNEQKTYLDSYFEYFPNIRLYANEFTGYQTYSDVPSVEFGYNNVAGIIAQSNAGFAGSASWFYSGDYIPTPVDMKMDGITTYNWATPSSGTYNISYLFAERGLADRYIPKHSKIVSTNTSSSDDIIAATYISQDNQDITVVMDVNSSNDSKNLTINLGSIANGKKFERHILEMIDEPDEKGNLIYTDRILDYVDSKGNRVGGPNAILPVTDKIVTCENGKIIDTLPQKHCMVVYTTLEEEVQIELKTCKETVDGVDYNSIEFPVNVNGTVELSVEKIYGTDGDTSKVTWEILGKSEAGDEDGFSGNSLLTDSRMAYTDNCLITENVGQLSSSSGSSVTYTASNVNVGDTVAIKVTSTVDTSAYNIAIISIK